MIDKADDVDDNILLTLIKVSFIEYFYKLLYIAPSHYYTVYHFSIDYCFITISFITYFLISIIPSTRASQYIAMGQNSHYSTAFSSRLLENLVENRDSGNFCQGAITLSITYHTFRTGSDFSEIWYDTLSNFNPGHVKSVRHAEDMWALPVLLKIV